MLSINLQRFHFRLWLQFLLCRNIIVGRIQLQCWDAEVPAPANISV